MKALKIVALLAAVAGLSGCVAYPAAAPPGYYYGGPAYYSGPAYYGPTVGVGVYAGPRYYHHRHW